MFCYFTWQGRGKEDAPDEAATGDEKNYGM
jgi:hypothetical protein